MSPQAQPIAIAIIRSTGTFAPATMRNTTTDADEHPRDVPPPATDVRADDDRERRRDADIDVVGERGADDPGVRLLRRVERGRMVRLEHLLDDPRPRTPPPAPGHGRHEQADRGRRNTRNATTSTIGYRTATNCESPMRKRSNGSGKLVEELDHVGLEPYERTLVDEGEEQADEEDEDRDHERQHVDGRPLGGRAADLDDVDRCCRETLRTPAVSSLQSHTLRRRRRGLVATGTMPCIPPQRFDDEQQQATDANTERQATDDVERVVRPRGRRARHPVQERDGRPRRCGRSG